MADSLHKSASLSVLTDKETTVDESLTIKECEQALMEKKALKKKLKKQKQKITKNNKAKAETDANENAVKMKTMKDRDNEQSTDNNHDNPASDCESSITEIDDSESTDIDYLIAISQFKQPIVDQKGVKKLHKKNDVKSMDPFRDSNNRNPPPQDDWSDFTCVTKGKKQTPVTFCKTPEGFGNAALTAITNGNFQLAINYLTRGIALDPMDTRHYLNRSYCFLRMGDYAQALSDIEYVSTRLTDLNEISQAKCRKGQILCILQKYEAAESAFHDSINLAPDRSSAERQLKRMQVEQIVQMGFNERDVLLALQNKSNTADAVNLLMSRPGEMNDNSYDTLDSISDDEIFYSDDENDPSNETLLSKILNYDPKLSYRPVIADPPPARAGTFKKFQELPRAASADRTLRVIKTVKPLPKAKPADRGLNDKAVWVGNLMPEHTDEIIKKRFSKFGKVTLVARPSNGSYVFVNFQHSASTEKALEEATYNGGNITFNDHHFYVKSATSRAFK